MSINARVKHKRDTASNWASKNPVLLEGEIIIVDDGGTMRLKMGDGSTAYSGLPFFNAASTSHIANKSNPHGVTKAQIGLGNVDNTSDVAKPVSTAQQIAIEDAKKAGTDAQDDIDSHTANKSNPHSVTKAQVGLGNVDNTADADKTVKYAATAGSLTNLTATVAELNILDGVTATAAEINKLDGLTATTTELNYVDGVTSAIQTQLNAKLGSTAQAADSAKLGGTAAASYAKLASPALTGTPTAPTATAGTNTTQIATTAFVTTAVANKTTVSGNAGSATKLATARTIDGVSFDGTAAITHFGTCSTAAATAAKTVALTGFTLVTGARVMVKFTVTNTASSPTLNVNSSGAKAIMYRGAAISAGYLAANRVYEFVYDGTDWELVGDVNTNTTYSNMTAATSSAAGTSGLVPAPAAGKQTSFLRGDGTWVVPTNTTYTAMTADEATTGTATTARSITAKVLHDKIAAMVSASSGITLKSYT